MLFLKRDNRKGVSQVYAGNAVKSIKIGRPFKNANARHFNCQPFSDSFLSASVKSSFQSAVKTVALKGAISVKIFGFVAFAFILKKFEFRIVSH